jgi:hypothetical protein
MQKEKGTISEEVSDLKQQLTKARSVGLEEIGELRRELFKARDLVEVERALRVKEELAGNLLRGREGDDRRQLSDSLSKQLNEKEIERIAEVDKGRMINLEVNKLQLQLEASRNSFEEAQGRYEYLRLEGRSARSQVLEAVGYAVDIIDITRSFAASRQTKEEREGRGERERIEEEDIRIDSSWVGEGEREKQTRSRSLLMLSPRAKANLKERERENNDTSFRGFSLPASFSEEPSLAGSPVRSKLFANQRYSLVFLFSFFYSGSFCLSCFFSSIPLSPSLFIFDHLSLPLTASSRQGSRKILLIERYCTVCATPFASLT